VISAVGRASDLFTVRRSRVHFSAEHHCTVILDKLLMPMFQIICVFFLQIAVAARPLVNRKVDILNASGKSVKPSSVHFFAGDDRFTTVHGMVDLVTASAVHLRLLKLI